MPNTLDIDFVRDNCWKADLFKGKVVFITGGSGSICRVQAEALILLGCKVAIIGRNMSKAETCAKEISELGKSSDCVLPIGNVDVRNFSQVEVAVKKCVEKFGRIDFVIAGAAGNFVSDFSNLSPNGFRSVIDIDLLGSFNTVKACYPELVKSKGSIIFISALFHYYGVPFQCHVSAAKAGIDALSRSLAVELGPMGIRVNCLAPGSIENTEGFRKLGGNISMEDARRKIPLQRFGSTNDIAQATIFLFSPAANYITGTVQIVDGGAWHTGTHFTNYLYPEMLICKMNANL